jgi:hypothetical protein
MRRRSQEWSNHHDVPPPPREKYQTAVERGKPWCDDWYGFCTWMQQVYRERNEPIAAMIWWALRYIDSQPIGDLRDPCTDDGAAELGEYWEYKLPIALREQAENRV